ncbi:hypothetical protein DPMN_049270 [Dreissena polymorpha]|uniref:Uncharacterized protein n=1 Tax=Dreissena polymorpha TaxID=45954 RepID=A0A9D4CEM7_DREPO|nr:hypothetical protein DPMN_049270 [Dreissena polymorpha]
MFRNSLEDEASSVHGHHLFHGLDEYVLNNARASGTIPSRCVAWNFRYRKATCPNSTTISTSRWNRRSSVPWRPRALRGENELRAAF